MSKIDRLKEEIGWLKVIFSILIAIDISLVNWIVQNYTKSTLFLLISCALGVLIITAGIIWLNRVAYKKIFELEDL